MRGHQPSYEELMRRLFYTRVIETPDGLLVVYWTYTGSIKSSSQWLVPNTGA